MSGGGGNEFLIMISLLTKILYCIEDFILFLRGDIFI